MFLHFSLLLVPFLPTRLSLSLTLMDFRREKEKRKPFSSLCLLCCLIQTFSDSRRTTTTEYPIVTLMHHFPFRRLARDQTTDRRQGGRARKKRTERFFLGDCIEKRKCLLYVRFLFDSDQQISRWLVHRRTSTVNGIVNKQKERSKGNQTR